MSLQSDIKLDVSKFQPDATLEATHAFYKNLAALTEGLPSWYEV
jgi:hypothetical protein